jgi:hypothetical protein
MRKMQQITSLYYSSLNGLDGCCRMPNCFTTEFYVTSLCIHDNVLPIWSGVYRLPLHTSPGITVKLHELHPINSFKYVFGASGYVTGTQGHGWVDITM